jgi:hypothetical protein
MRWRSLGWAAACLAGACGLLCGAEPTPATVLKAVSEKLSLPSGTAPVAVRVTDTDGAQKWELQFEDANFKGNRRLVEFQDGKVVDDRAGNVGSSGPGAPLQPVELAGRISDVRERVLKLAEMAQVDCHRLRLLLSRAAADAPAHWEVEVAAKSGHIVGRVVFGAPEPRLIASSWGADAKIVGPSQKSIDRELDDLGREAEKAFQEIQESLRHILKGDEEGMRQDKPHNP